MARKYKGKVKWSTVLRIRKKHEDREHRHVKVKGKGRVCTHPNVHKKSTINWDPIGTEKKQRKRRYRTGDAWYVKYRKAIDWNILPGGEGEE